MLVLLVISILVNIILSVMVYLQHDSIKNITLVDLEKRFQTVQKLEKQIEHFRIKVEEVKLEYEDCLIYILQDLEFYSSKRRELIEELEALQEELDECQK